MRDTTAEIWFATNALTGLAEEHRTCETRRLALQVTPSICHGSATLHLSVPHSSLTARLAVSLFDLSGRLVFRSALDARASSFPLDLRSLPAGVYLVRVTAGTETAQTRVLRL